MTGDINCINLVCLQFEGLPMYPDPGRFWAIVDKYKVSKFYTAPTAIRALMKYGDDYVTK
jgi:acetyl-CoA synthetase